jgi:heme/copper-type cytochrome/quinol oxidase subunit 2
MSALAALLPLAAEDAATEGKKVITAMLIVGLIFVGVIALGETTKAWNHRRRARRPRRY